MPRARLADLRGLDELKIESALVHAFCKGAGASPVSLRLRSETGALVVGVRRGNSLSHPDPTVPFEPGDVVYFVGTSEALTKALALFEPDPVRMSTRPTAEG